MSNNMDIFRQLIKQSAIQSITDNYGKKQVILNEPQYPTVSVTISGLPENTLVIKADSFIAPDSIFIGSKGECKRADFIIIADTNRKKVIICIEMKATKGRETEIIQQLNGTLCFLHYCQQIGKTFWNQSDFMDDVAYRFVSISHISIAKNKTRFERDRQLHDRPDRMLKVAYPHHLQFNHLAGLG